MNKKDDNLEAVGYIRVSSESQSYNRQIEDIKHYAKDKEFKLVKIFKDVISASFRDLDDRDGFNKMKLYINKNNIKNILLLEISRLGRRNNEIQNSLEYFNNNKINVHLKDLNLSTLEANGDISPTANIMVTLFGAMAANEIRHLSERVKSGRYSNARKNKSFNGKIIGYRKGKDGTPEIDPEESKIIIRIFDLACDGYGGHTISKIILAEFEKKIAMSTINGIIRNPFHKGIRLYKDLELPVPPIVSNSVWNRANKNIDNRAKNISRRTKHTNILSGKIFCKNCGKIMYQVINVNSRTDTFKCKINECLSVNRPWLYDVIREAVLVYSKDEKVKEKKDDLLQRLRTNEKIIENLKNDLTEQKRKKTRLLDGFVTGNFEKEYIDEVLKTINTKINSIKNDIDNHDNKDYLLNNQLNTEIELFSEDLEMFKLEITNIVRKVEVSKTKVFIYFLGAMASIDILKGNYLRSYRIAKNEGKDYVRQIPHFEFDAFYEPVDIEAWSYEQTNPKEFEKMLNAHIKKVENKKNKN